MEYKILAVEWRSARRTVGFVAYATPNPGNASLWCVAVGPVMYDCNDEQEDIQWIARFGAKLSWQEAQAFFPNLDIANYKYFPGND